MIDPADELGRRELPAHEHDQDDAELDHEVRRGEHEHHGRRRSRAPFANSDLAIADAAYEQDDETMP